MICFGIIVIEVDSGPQLCNANRWNEVANCGNEKEGND